MDAHLKPAISTYMLRTYSLLAVVVLTIFGVARIYTGPLVILGVLELMGGAILLLNILIPALSSKVNYVKNTLLGVMLFFLGVMLVTGGTRGAGILWLFVFPAGTFFLTGQRGGVRWMIALFVLIATVGVLGANGVIDIPYDTLTLLQLAGSLFVVTLGVYVYQQSRERLVTQTLESRAALQVEKLKADIIVQSLAEGIVATDATGKVTFINRAAEKMLGWGRGELLDRNFIDKVSMVTEAGKNVAPVDRPLRQCLESNKSISARVIYRRKDGKLIPVALTQTPYVVKGKVTGAIGTLRDIREEEEMVRAKSEFVTLASHQLRTPISAISWMSELLLDGDAGALRPEQRKHISDIYKSNQRMAALVGEMLIVSSLDLQSLPVTPEKINLATMAANAVKEQVSLESYKHKITERFSPTLPKISCDPAIIKLILRNLLSNAFKYTPSTGQITIDILIDRTLKLHHESKGSVIITITDTGYGIPREAHNKIFSKFFRAPNITDKDTDGTGLGLYIVKALLDYVGGSVSFSSHEGRGTIFSVALPLEGMAKHEVKDTKAARAALQIERKEVHV